MKAAFLLRPAGTPVLFSGSGRDPDFVFLLRLLFPWRERRSEGSYEWSTLPLFSRFSGDLKLLKVWGRVTARRCLCDAHQASAGGRRRHRHRHRHRVFEPRARPPCVSRRRDRGHGAPCSQIHVILAANHFCSHMTSLPDWFHSAVEGGKIKQMLSGIAAAVRRGGRGGGGRGGGSGVGGCLLERWSEGWRWRERESVIQSAAPCHVVTRYSGGKVLVYKAPLLLFTARWLLVSFFFLCVCVCFCGGGRRRGPLSDSFTMPLSTHARNNGCVIWNDSLQSTIINVVIHF